MSSKNFGEIPVPGLLIPNMSFEIFVPLQILVVETILLLANFTASVSTSKFSLLELPFEISAILNSLTSFENPY